MPLSATRSCFDRTLARLRETEQGRKLRRAEIEQLTLLTRALGNDIVDAYSTDVAPGEIGRGGSGVASAAAAQSGDCPTGLLYGRVQSGKTNAMILTAAVAVDNSVKVVIVLTSDSTELVGQTVRRFRTVVGPRVYSSDHKDQWDDHENMRLNLENGGVIFICAKNGRLLLALNRTLEAIGAGNYPALILDDEADQATPDTTAAARAMGHASAPARPSAVNRRIMGNNDPDELARSLREMLRHNVLLQVTATPNALFLQGIESPLRPKFTRLLVPGRGYCGGENFFSLRQIEDPQPPIVHVPEDEEPRIVASRQTPEGLRRAIIYFLVAASARLIDQGGTIDGGMKCLIHPSLRKTKHRIACDMVRATTSDIARNFTAYQGELRAAYADLRRTLPSAPSFNDISQFVRDRISQREVVLANSDGDYGNFANEFNFLVGGNILGRGLTIDNLIVTYYLRRPVTAQMDTMAQHARMYGYRSEIMPYTRIFLPRGLATRFRLIHESETAQREFIEREGGRHVNVRVAGNLRPTRAGVLIPSMIGSYRGGQQIYPVEPIFSGPAVEALCVQFDRSIRAAHPARQMIDVGFARVEQIIEQIPISPDDPGSWDREKLLAALRTIQGDTTTYLWHREAPNRRGTRLAAGVAGQEEVTLAHRRNAPVLMMFRISGRNGWAGTPFWYPTLVFPKRTTVVFNLS